MCTHAPTAVVPTSVVFQGYRYHTRAQTARDTTTNIEKDMRQL